MSVLIICEKPSVAKTVALALGAAEQTDGYLSGDGLLVSWCIGHLISMADAGSYDERYKKWRYEDLPILPQTWKYAPTPGKEKQLAVLKELLHRSDVSEDARSPFPVFGFPQWRTAPSARALPDAEPERNTTRCINRRCAVRGQTGLWVSMRRGFSPYCTIRP